MQSNLKLFYLFTIMVLLSLLSCNGGSTPADRGGDTVKLKYAENITIVKHKGYTVVSLKDPWNAGKTLHTYVLVPADETLPAQLPQGTVVRTPLRRAVITTSVHCGLVSNLGKRSSIKGICELKYINLPWIHEQYKKGNIIDCGSGLAPTLESIIEANADAIIISPFQNNGGYGRLEELKKPIVEAADYMETSALGRAEWVKFYGMLFGAEEKAKAMFNSVEANYQKLQQLAATSTIKQTVMIDKKNGSVWYVPGGHSTIGRIIADANTLYPFADNDKSGSLALPFEAVLEKAGNADVWMLRYNSPKDLTLNDLRSDYQGYTQFKAFQRHEVYGCNTGSNNFYEETPFRPDLLLRDFIIITHPDLKALGKPTYFTKIE